MKIENKKTTFSYFMYSHRLIFLFRDLILPWTSKNERASVTRGKSSPFLRLTIQQWDTYIQREQDQERERGREKGALSRPPASSSAKIPPGHKSAISRCVCVCVCVLCSLSLASCTDSLNLLERNERRPREKRACSLSSHAYLFSSI